MKVSLKWLSDYVEIPGDLKEFCDRLDLTGTGVEGVETTGNQLDGVVVGYIETCEPHPDSDHMHVVMVNVGQDEPVQVVCGAPNVAAHRKVALAQVGAVLPGDFKIKRSKLRGVMSCGMCCSRRELGLGTDHDGIWILPDDAPVGCTLTDYLNLADTVLDLEITPNRPDSLSIAGFAREVGAMYQQDWNNPLLAMASKMQLSSELDPLASDVTINIEDPQRCPRYTTRIIRGVKIGPSPDWLVERLASIGQRSINNIVDVTNYILFLLGQPLHAFDLNKLKSHDGIAHIIVRAAQDGEELVTLDGEKRILNPDMTVIATPERAVALAGVMGGLETEVTDETTDILLEAATFEAGRTSRTSRNLGLISESSLRYERGVDDHGIELRSAAAAALMVEVAGGVVSEIVGSDGQPAVSDSGIDQSGTAGVALQGILDVWPQISQPRTLSFHTERFNKLMGAEIPHEFIVDILERLGCAVKATTTESELSVTAPTFRPDLEREIDLYEEVLRLWGMDRIPSSLPSGSGRVGVRSLEERRIDTINYSLRASGLNETMTYSFASPEDLQWLGLPQEGLGEPVELINPMSTEQSQLRRSIIPGLLRSLAYNQAHGVANIQLYEIGKTFHAGGSRQLPKEKQQLAGVLLGSMNEAGWNVTSQPFDFFDGKGVLEALARELALPNLRMKALTAEEAPHLQPGRAAQVLADGAVLGWLGEIHPRAVARFEISGSVVAFELDVAALIKQSSDVRPYQDVSQFPAVSVDIALVLDESVSNEEVLRSLHSAGGRLLEDIRLFDVYRDDERLGQGKKSLAYTLRYRAADRTLTSAEVEKAYAKLVKKVCAATGAQVRS